MFGNADHDQQEFARHWNEMASGKPTPSRYRVIQDGRQVGTVPASFNPHMAQSSSILYDFRPGDFVQQGDDWIAHGSLGDGDLAAVPGFRFDRGEEQ